VGVGGGSGRGCRRLQGNLRGFQGFQALNPAVKRVVNGLGLDKSAAHDRGDE